MNNYKQKIQLREKRAKRAKAVRELRAKGATLNEIASMLRISVKTVESDLKDRGHIPLSRNTWKDPSLMKPTKEGWYFLSAWPEKEEIIQQVEWLAKNDLKNFSFYYWCGPIAMPRLDLDEIEMERKLREVTK